MNKKTKIEGSWLGIIFGILAVVIIILILGIDIYLNMKANPTIKECNQICQTQDYDYGEYEYSYELKKDVCRCKNRPGKIIKIYD